MRELPRVLANLAATGYGAFVAALSPILSIPIFLWAWGPERFGEWSVLFTIPGFLVFADLGIGLVAANEMVIALHRGNRFEAEQLMRETTSLLVWLSPLVGIAAFVVSAAFLITVPLANFSLGESLVAVALLIAFSLASLWLQPFAAQFRCADQFPRFVALVTHLRLAQTIALLVCITLSHSPILAATAFFLSQILFSIVLYRTAPRPLGPFSFSPYSWTHSRMGILCRPALFLAAFPLGSALTINGATLAVFLSLGAHGVAVFAAARTVARGLVQIAETLKQSLWPEFTRLFSLADFAALRRLIFAALIGFLALALPTAALLFWQSALIFSFWTHGALNPSPLLLGFLLVAALANATWSLAATVHQSINRHELIARAFLAQSFCISAAVFIVPASFIPIALALGEIFLVAITARELRSVLRV